MTSSEILNIVVTVGICQLIIDLLANYFVYNNDQYKRSVRSMERYQIKLSKVSVELKKSEKKYRKKYDRAETDYSASCADVARRHFPPNMLSSIFFVILLRILGTEHKGKVSLCSSYNNTLIVFCILYTILYYIILPYSILTIPYFSSSFLFDIRIFYLLYRLWEYYHLYHII
jgi:hypothetical protein